MFFGGERVARKDFSGSMTSVFYYFSDHLKTASVITDSAGTIKADSDYYPWGGELGRGITGMLLVALIRARVGEFRCCRKACPDLHRTD